MLGKKTEYLPQHGTISFSGVSACQQYRQTVVKHAGDFRREQLDARAAAVKDYLVKQAMKLKIAYIRDPDGNNWCSGF